MAARPLTAEEFSEILKTHFAGHVFGAKNIAVGVSGGPDSMALARLLSLWAKKNKIQVYALSVDHGLRANSAKEAKQVAARVRGWPNTRHEILAWRGVKPKTRLMEAARAVRYKLIAEYCRKHKIKYLFLAHHQDDQAETVLFRLAKGSGLDGLSGIKPVQDYDRNLTFLRPLLDIPKERLIATCKQYKIPVIKDPSNMADKFARPRLRKAWKVLEAEGLSSKRLSVTASRLERARKALDEITEKTFSDNVLAMSPGRIVLNAKGWKKAPEEIQLRALIRAIEHLRPDAAYRPRMEKIEDLFADLRDSRPFRKRTLGGLVFERDDMKNTIQILLEKK